VSSVTENGPLPGTWAGEVLQRGLAGGPDESPDGESSTGPAIRYAQLPVASIRPNPRQPRSVFDEEALDELAASLTQIGLLQPIVVRPVDDQPVETVDSGVGQQGRPTSESYELVAGERRLRAATTLGWDMIPAMVRPTDDTDLLRDALLENVHRAALNPLEEAAAYQQLLADFGCTQEELAHRVGRSRPQIANTIRLLRLPPSVQRRVAAGVLTQGHARALLALPEQADMEALAARIVAEGLSVRAVEEIVAVGERPVRGRPRQRRPSAQSEDLRGVADALGDRLDTRVQVTMGRTKGRVTIEFAGQEDLARIVEILTRGGTTT
jgi:ParB family chromosome partitioning protein